MGLGPVHPVDRRLGADPAEQATSQLQLWLLERWDVTVKNVEAIDPSNVGEGRWHLNDRETVAWYDENAVFLPTTRMAEACGGALKPEALARVLNDRGLLTRRTDAKRLAVRYVPKLGKGSWYALCRTAFGRTSLPDAGLQGPRGRSVLSWPRLLDALEVALGSAHERWFSPPFTTSRPAGGDN